MMDLIERYIEETRTYLPKDLRDEVCTELRSTVEASVEARLKEETELTREDVTREVLKELGAPHEFADAHVPRPRVLFGPRLYPAFIRTMKVAAAILVGLAAIGVFVDLSSSLTVGTMVGSLFSAFKSVLMGSLVILGIAVVVFSILERTAALPQTRDEEWDPADLPEVDDPDQVSLVDRVGSIAFLVVALVMLNFFRDWIGAHVTMNDESGWIPLLGVVFESHLWLLNLCLALDLLVNFLVLLRWRWTVPLRWATFAVNCLYVTWLGYLAFDPAILDIDPAWMASHGWSEEAIANYEELFERLSGIVKLNLKLGFIAACVGLAYSLFKILRRMLTGA